MQQVWKAGDRVIVQDTNSLHHGKRGIVRLYDRHGQVWLDIVGTLIRAAFRAAQLVPEPVMATAAPLQVVVAPPQVGGDHVVDVIIPYYEGLRFLPETINSILWQVKTAPTIHLINDCSPEDDTPVRVQFKNYSNIHWYKTKENCGPYKATNGVFRFLTADIIVIQDSDDISLPQRVNYSVSEMQRLGGDIIAGSMTQFVDPQEVPNKANREYLNRVPVLKSGQSWALVPSGCLVNGVTTMTRSCFIANNGFDGTMHCTADTEFSERCHRNPAITPIVSDAILGLRRLHNYSLSRGNGKFNQHKEVRKKYQRAIYNRIALWNGQELFDSTIWGTLDNTAADVVQRVK